MEICLFEDKYSQSGITGRDMMEDVGLPIARKNMYRAFNLIRKCKYIQDRYKATWSNVWQDDNDDGVIIYIFHTCSL